MGLKVHQILDEADLKEKAKKRKEDSDEVLENVYSMLVMNIKKKTDDKEATWSHCDSALFYSHSLKAIIRYIIEDNNLHIDRLVTDLRPVSLFILVVKC